MWGVSAPHVVHLVWSGFNASEHPLAAMSRAVSMWKYHLEGVSCWSRGVWKRSNSKDLWTVWGLTRARWIWWLAQWAPWAFWWEDVGELMEWSGPRVSGLLVLPMEPKVVGWCPCSKCSECQLFCGCACAAVHVRVCNRGLCMWVSGAIFEWTL